MVEVAVLGLGGHGFLVTLDGLHGLTSTEVQTPLAEQEENACSWQNNMSVDGGE